MIHQASTHYAHHDIRTTPSFVLFFRSNRMDRRTASTKGPKHDCITQNIQLLWHFSLNIGVFERQSIRSQSRSIQVICLSALDDSVDLFTRFCDSLQDGLELSQFWSFPAFDFQVPVKAFEILLFLGVQSGR